MNRLFISSDEMFNETIRIPIKRCWDCNKEIFEGSTMCLCQFIKLVKGENPILKTYSSVKTKVIKKYELAS